jgi:hypothetical protein
VILPEDTRAEPLGQGVVAAVDVDRRDLAVVADVDDLAVDRINDALKRRPAAGGHMAASLMRMTTPFGPTAVVSFPP